MSDPSIHNLDLNRLNDYSRRMASQLIPAFPAEILAFVKHSEDYFEPSGKRFIGAWVAEWVNPSETCEWGCNVMVSTEDTMITVRWLGDHQHFANWGREPDDPEMTAAKTYLADIFEEKVWFISPEKSGHGRVLKPEEIDRYVAKSARSSYTIQSWRGTHNATRQK